jgi:hypothetical protein
LQVDPIKPTLKAPATERSNLKSDDPLSGFTFNFNLRRYTKGTLVFLFDNSFSYLNSKSIKYRIQTLTAVADRIGTLTGEVDRIETRTAVVDQAEALTGG